MLYIVETERTLEDISERMPVIAQKYKFGVLNVIDMQEKMRDKGVEFDTPSRIFELCNPQKAKTVLEKNPAMSTALPCRISVYEEDGVLKLATIRPTAIIDLYHEHGLDDIAREIDGTLQQLMNEVAG